MNGTWRPGAAAGNAGYRQAIGDKGEEMLEHVNALDDSLERRFGRPQADASMAMVQKCLDSATDLYVMAEHNASIRRCALLDRLRQAGWAIKDTAQSPDGPTQTALRDGPVDVDALLHESTRWKQN